MPPKQAQEAIYIAVIGVGGVGSRFLAQLHYLQKTTYPHLQAHILTRSTRSLTGHPSSSGIDLSNWSSVLSSSTENGLTPAQVQGHLEGRSHNSRCVVIDNTSSQAVAEYYPQLLKAGFSIATPNKKAFSGSQDLWDDILRYSYHPHHRPDAGLVYHESSAGAGMPVISTLRDLVESGDRVKRIEGVVSGSLSFLFNEFMPLSDSASDAGAKTPWSAHVKKAQELGYTEPDPRDDLSGLDVARKLVILARVAGLKVEGGTDSFPIQSLIPKALQGVESGAEFLARLPESDGEMEDMRKRAKEEGKVVRYVGSVDVEKGKLKVGMEWLDGRSPLAGLRGSANVFGFWTERYGEEPLVVQGAGAGGELTAMGVTADLIKIVQRLR